MTFCQKKFPADPSKSVEYNAVKWLMLEAWEAKHVNLCDMDNNTNNSNVEREALGLWNAWFGTTLISLDWNNITV